MLVDNAKVPSGPWDDIARYRGVTNLLMDLVERPEFSHQLVRKLTDISLSYLEQVEALGLFDNNPTDLHYKPVHIDNLPSKDFDGVHLKRKDIWGRGFAQIFASVSKKMHEEFDIEYMKETIAPVTLYLKILVPVVKDLKISLNGNRLLWNWSIIIKSNYSCNFFK